MLLLIHAACVTKLLNTVQELGYQTADSF